MDLTQFSRNFFDFLHSIPIEYRIDKVNSTIWNSNPNKETNWQTWQIQMITKCTTVDLMLIGCYRLTFERLKTTLLLKGQHLQITKKQTLDSLQNNSMMYKLSTERWFHLTMKIHNEYIINNFVYSLTMTMITNQRYEIFFQMKIRNYFQKMKQIFIQFTSKLISLFDNRIYQWKIQ